MIYLIRFYSKSLVSFYISLYKYVATHSTYLGISKIEEMYYKEGYNNSKTHLVCRIDIGYILRV
jgi:hypothetical protein